MSQFTEQYHGGVYVIFNWAIERNSVAKLVETVALAHNQGVTRVHLVLHSAGGLLGDAFHAVETLRSFPITYITYNTSTVQSAANLIFMLGERRSAVADATFFYHQTGFEGIAGQRSSEREIRDQLALIEQGDRRTAEFIAQAAGISVDDVLDWQRQGRTLSADEARAAGIVHTVGRPVIGPNAFVQQVIL